MSVIGWWLVFAVALLALWALATAMGRKTSRDMRRLLIAQARADEEG